LRVGVIGESLCLLMPSMSSDIGGFGEFGEKIFSSIRCSAQIQGENVVKDQEQCSWIGY